MSSQQDKHQPKNREPTIKTQPQKQKLPKKPTKSSHFSKVLAPHRLMFQQRLVTSEFPLAALAARRRPGEARQGQDVRRRRRRRGRRGGPRRVAEDVAEAGAGGEIGVGLAQGTANVLGWWLYESGCYIWLNNMIYVHMYMWTNVFMYKSKYVHMYICTYVWMYICKYANMYICIYVNMYVCIN